MENVNGQPLIHDDEQLKRWREPFKAVLNRIISDEVLSSVNKMSSSRNVWIQTVYLPQEK